MDYQQEASSIGQAGQKSGLSSRAERANAWVRWETLVLTGILVLGFVLRTGGIGFGLPYSYHFDETTYTGMGLNLGAGVLSVQINPTGYSNLLFGQYALYFIFGLLTGQFQSAADFAKAYTVDPTPFILIARMSSVVLGTLTIGLVYLLGKEVRSRAVGLMAAFLLSVAFIHVRDSHFAVPDTPTTFFTTLTILLCVQAIRRSSLRLLLAASAAAGFAIAVKWSVLPIALPVGTALFFSRSSGARLAETFRQLRKPALLSAVAMAGGFLVGGFQLLLMPFIYVDYAVNKLGAGSLGSVVTAPVNRLPGWVFYLKMLGVGLGYFLLGLCLAGAIYLAARSISKRDPTGLLLLIFPVTYFLAIGSTYHYFVRYIMPVVPLLLLFAADLLLAAATWIERKQARWGLALVAAALAASVLPMIAADLRFNYLLGQTDTRTLAKKWVEANIPGGTAIAIDWPVHSPPLSTLEKPVPESSRVYKVTDFMKGGGLYRRPLPWFRENGIDYLIATSFIYDLRPSDAADVAKREAFYGQLDREAELMQEFQPYIVETEPPLLFEETYGPFISLWNRERPGPTIKIYRLR